MFDLSYVLRKIWKFFFWKVEWQFDLKCRALSIFPFFFFFQ